MISLHLQLLLLLNLDIFHAVESSHQNSLHNGRNLTYSEAVL
jgi:hypothetical protein